jgi:hypothetical protein
LLHGAAPVAQNQVSTSEAIPPIEEGHAPPRSCPRCHHTLDWIETGELDGALFDYYRWCARGCGLYCFDRGADSFVRLA